MTSTFCDIFRYSLLNVYDIFHEWNVCCFLLLKLFVDLKYLSHFHIVNLFTLKALFLKRIFTSSVTFITSLAYSCSPWTQVLVEMKFYKDSCKSPNILYEINRYLFSLEKQMRCTFHTALAWSNIIIRDHSVKRHIPMDSWA